MRGKQTIESALNDAIGITPADAGKTLQLLLPSCRTEDHPRGCGENLKTVGKKRHREGSPPRMRGKRIGRELYTAPFRITPADAGKTIFSLDALAASWDHPRGCGENLHPCKLCEDFYGSPPRMRGKRIHNL